MNRWLKWTIAKLKDTRGFWGSSPSPPSQPAPSPPVYTPPPAPPAPAPTPTPTPTSGGTTTSGLGPSRAMPAAGARGWGRVGPTWGVSSPDYWRQLEELRRRGFLR